MCPAVVVIGGPLARMRGPAMMPSSTASRSSWAWCPRAAQSRTVCDPGSEHTSRCLHALEQRPLRPTRARRAAAYPEPRRRVRCTWASTKPGSSVASP